MSSKFAAKFLLQVAIPGRLVPNSRPGTEFSRFFVKAHQPSGPPALRRDLFPASTVGNKVQYELGYIMIEIIAKHVLLFGFAGWLAGEDNETVPAPLRVD